MFDTLILQYLNKLVESKIGDFTPPHHAIKVQRFNGNCVKLLTKFRKLPLKIFALVRDFSIETGDLPQHRHQPLEPFSLRLNALLRD